MSPRSVPRVSVCMATYNGSAYVVEQITSILDQLDTSDELIVVDDASNDNTADLIEELGDERIQLHRAKRNRGYVRSFEEALGRARGQYLFLSDQDDVWRPGRLDTMCASLATHAVVATNLATLDHGDRLRGPLGQEDWVLKAADSTHHDRNLLGILTGARPYYGCAMAVRREVLPLALPFPGFLTESHDLWLAILGNLAGSIEHLEIRSLDRRLHEANQTPTRPRGVVAAFKSRVLLLRSLGVLRRRVAAFRAMRRRNS